MADPVIYPFDPTGRAATNRINNEEIVILPPGNRLFHYAMPVAAPFFEEGLVVAIRDLNNNIIPLTLGVDYYLGHKFSQASLATMHDIWGSITFLRRDIVGTLLVSYNHLGGIWTIDSATMSEVLLDLIRNPRVTTWEEVVERPIDFPVIDHPWDLADMVGMKEIYEVIEKFYTAYLNNMGGGTGNLPAHLADFNNPHKVTAGQVGAYNKTEIDAILIGYLKTNGIAADSFKLGGKTLTEVISMTSSAKVDNAALADRALIADRAELADNATLLGGMSLLALQQYIRTARVETADKLFGLSVEELSEQIRQEASADAERLGGKTLEEIMAELTAVTGDASTLEGKTLTEIMLDVVTTKVNASIRSDATTTFGNRTYPEMRTDVLSGKAADAFKLDGKTLEEIKTDISSSMTDASTLQGKTLAQLMADVKTTKVDNAALADNSTRFGGKTYAELLEVVSLNKSALFSFDNITIEPPASGNLDPNLAVFRLGLMQAGNTVPADGTSIRVSMFYNDRIDEYSIQLKLLADGTSVTMDVYSNSNLGNVVFSKRIGFAPNTPNNTTWCEVFIRYSKVNGPRAFGVSQLYNNRFIVGPTILAYDPAHSRVSSLTWNSEQRSREVIDLNVMVQNAFNDAGTRINQSVQAYLPPN